MRVTNTQETFKIYRVLRSIFKVAIVVDHGRHVFKIYFCALIVSFFWIDNVAFNLQWSRLQTSRSIVIKRKVFVPFFIGASKTQIQDQSKFRRLDQFLSDPNRPDQLSNYNFPKISDHLKLSIPHKIFSHTQLTTPTNFGPSKISASFFFNTLIPFHI
jgi:hypothetical protein